MVAGSLVYKFRGSERVSVSECNSEGVRGSQCVCARAWRWALASLALSLSYALSLFLLRLAESSERLD
eukprot:3432081-Rhodomonas_salina.2